MVFVQMTPLNSCLLLCDDDDDDVVKLILILFLVMSFMDLLVLLFR